MEIILYILLAIFAVGAIIFVISGKSLTNGIDMPKSGTVGIILFLFGSFGFIIWAIIRILVETLQ